MAKDCRSSWDTCSLLSPANYFRKPYALWIKSWLSHKGLTTKSLSPRCHFWKTKQRNKKTNKQPPPPQQINLTIMGSSGKSLGHWRRDKKYTVELWSLFLFPFWPQSECFIPTQAPTMIAVSSQALRKDPTTQGLEASKMDENKLFRLAR